MLAISSINTPGAKNVNIYQEDSINVVKTPWHLLFFDTLFTFGKLTFNAG